MIGDRLRLLREEKNINQEQLAQALSVSASAIGMYETGRREPNNDLTIKLSEYFNVSTDYLLGKSDIRNPEIQSPVENKLDLNGLDAEDYIMLQNLIHYIHYLKEKNK